MTKTLSELAAEKVTAHIESMKAMENDIVENLIAELLPRQKEMFKAMYPKGYTEKQLPNVLHQLEYTLLQNKAKNRTE